MQPIKLKTEGSKLILDRQGAEHALELNHRIYLACLFNNRIYVLFDPLFNSDIPEGSIICLDPDGSFIWGVSNANSMERMPNSVKFNSMGFYDDKTLYARGGSTDYWISLDTGKIIRSEWTK